MIKVNTETPSETDTFVAVESQEDDIFHNKRTVDENGCFGVVNPGFSTNQSYDKLPFSDMNICFKTPSEEWKTFKVHKVFLVNYSGYVADKIGEDQNGDKTKIVIMERSIDESDMKIVLDVIYCGRSESLTKKKENQILDLLSFFKVKNFKIVQVAEPQNMNSPFALPLSMNMGVSEEKKKRTTSPGNLEAPVSTPKKVKVEKQKTKVEKPKIKVEKMETKVEKPKVKVEKTKIKVEKVDHTNSTPFTDEELALAMQYNIIPIEEGACLCMTCGNVFSRIDNGKRHFKKVHAYQGADTTFCQGCGVKFPTFQMIEHFKNQSCGFEFNEKIKKGQDNVTDDMDKFIVVPEPGKAMCLICNKEFSRLDNAKRHYQKTHSFKSEIKVHCVLCGKDYKDIANHYKNEHNVGQSNIDKWFSKLME